MLTSAAVVAAVGWAATGVVELVHDQSEADFETTADYVLELAFLIGLVGSTVALWRLAPEGPALTRWAAWAAAGGFGLLSVSAAITLGLGSNDDPGPIGALFPLGLLVLVLGLIVLVAESIRRRFVPRWFPPVLLLAFVVLVVLQDYGGAFAMTAAWLALAYTSSEASAGRG